MDVDYFNIPPWVKQGDGITTVIYFVARREILLKSEIRFILMLYN